MNSGGSFNVLPERPLRDRSLGCDEISILKLVWVAYTTIQLYFNFFITHDCIKMRRGNVNFIMIFMAILRGSL